MSQQAVLDNGLTAAQMGEIEGVVAEWRGATASSFVENVPADADALVKRGYFLSGTEGAFAIPFGSRMWLIVETDGYSHS